MGCREGREGSSSRGFKPGCGDGRRRSGRDGEEEGVRVMGTRRYRQTDRQRQTQGAETESSGQARQALALRETSVTASLHATFSSEPLVLAPLHHEHLSFV